MELGIYHIFWRGQIALYHIIISKAYICLGPIPNQLSFLMSRTILNHLWFCRCDNCIASYRGSHESSWSSWLKVPLPVIGEIRTNCFVSLTTEHPRWKEIEQIYIYFNSIIFLLRKSTILWQMVCELLYFHVWLLLVLWQRAILVSKKKDKELSSFSFNLCRLQTKACLLNFSALI
jgi:hypothetical protein